MLYKTSYNTNQTSDENIPTGGCHATAHAQINHTTQAVTTNKHQTDANFKCPFSAVNITWHPETCHSKLITTEPDQYQYKKW